MVRRIFIAQIAQSAITDCVHTYVQYQTYMVLWYSTGRMYKYSTGQGFSDLVEIGQAAAAARRKFSKINSYLLESTCSFKLLTGRSTAVLLINSTNTGRSTNLPVDLQPYY